MSELLDQVLLADERRRAALVEANAETLGGLLSPELHFVHTTGALEDRASLLHKVATAALHYHEIALLDTNVFLLDGMAVQCSELDISVLASGSVKSIRCRTLATWIRVEGRWLLRHYQATRIAA